MPSYEKGAVRIHFEEAGSGFPLLVIAGGGLNSTISGLTGERAPFDAIAEFKGEYRVIAADLVNPQLGNLVDSVCTHFGEEAQWQFDMGMLYNASAGGILHRLELIGLPGRAPPLEDGTIWLSLTRDGENFTTERAVQIGVAGQHYKRLQWRPRTNFRTYLGMRVRGLTSAMPGFATCEATLSPLSA